MESLLSHSFDYLSSNDSNKTRKGLRQLEGLLAQICLSKSGVTSVADRRRSIATTKAQDSVPKELAQLKDDAAFREFFKLQEGFQFNGEHIPDYARTKLTGEVALRLVGCLEKLLGQSSNGQNDLLIISTLDLLHGVLLMHPPSRSLFGREIYMNLLLDLLDPTLCPAIHSNTLLCLVSALLSNSANVRLFEALDGLLCVTSLSKSRSATREVKMKSVEFLYFYLMPETPEQVVYMNGTMQRNWGADAGWNTGSKKEMEAVSEIEEKQELLGKYLSNVQDLVEDLRESMPFGAAF